MDEPTPCEWLARCAARLGERWRTVPDFELEEVAIEVWQDEALRGLGPEEAASKWLAPVEPGGICVPSARLCADATNTDKASLTGGNRPVSR
jgi:hypothetical protein